MKRLFLFAAFIENNQVGPALAHYVSSLGRLGDVVLWSDSLVDESQLQSLEVLHTEAERHGEYDFGSYKRCYLWAKENLDLETYDTVYLVNDSVFGPLHDLGECLERMEGQGKDAFCIAYFPHKTHPHMQTWFVGFTQNVFLQEWFDEFMQSVEKTSSKEEVCVKYEEGLSKLLESKGIAIASLYSAPHKDIYNKPLKYYRKGLPFVKKSSFVRHNGSLGYQLRKEVADLPEDVKEAVLSEAGMLWGEKYVDSLMRSGRVRSAAHYEKYLLKKILRRG